LRRLDDQADGHCADTAFAPNPLGERHLEA
jgi:hypothetical protein